ncbi:MAG: Ig-like domain-containing protein, partial [Gammaproteobacteria bacterium]|nr:Ig-like domain-containing protein [Gammaproteobacteria bacterium]
PYTPQFAGLYFFRAIYSGDSNYVSSQSGITDEPLPVTSGSTPSHTATLLSALSIQIGQSVTDSVSVTGAGGVPSGSVRFEVQAVGSSAWVQFGSDKTLNSTGMATSDPYVPTFAGTYYFRAVYGGDGVFANSVSGDLEEPLTIVAGTTASTTTTLLSSDNIRIGNSVTDTATVTGVGGTPSGTVLFQVRVSGSSAWTTFSTKPLSSGSATSDPYVPASAGAYNFRALYSGDATYANSISGDLDEPLTVTSGSASSTATTLLSASSILVNNAVTDTVTVTGSSGTPSGYVTFEVQAPGSSVWTQFGSVKMLDLSGKATSDPYIPSLTGLYHFRAHYGGSSLYAVSVSGDTEEPLTVAALLSTTRTVLSATSVTYSQSVTDTAIVSGAGLAPTGTVAFQVQVPGSSTWTQFGTNKTLDNTGHATSDVYTPQGAGTFYFRAVYYGDETYAASTSGDTEEPLQAIPLTSTTTTLLSTSSLTLGQSTTDSVTVTGVDGGPTITGTVRFETLKPGSSTWAVFGSIKTLDISGHATSDSYMPQAAGVTYFRAVYLGAGYYAGSQSGNTEEPLTVNMASTSTSTQLSSTSITFGQTVTDTATVQGVAGGPTPTGTVTFQVSVNGGSSWSQVGSPKTLTGGSATSDYYAPFSVGSYNFRAVYSGDSNYFGSQSGNAEEPLTIAMAPGTFGNYMISSAGQCGQSAFLTNNTASPLNPYSKVNPQLSNGHPSTTFSSDKPVPSIKTAGTITLVYFLQTTQVSNQNWQTIQTTLGFTYQGQSYTIGTAAFNATASKCSPPPLYYTVKFDVTGHTFINGYPPQVIPAGSTITLTTTLVNPANRVDLYGGTAGTQIILF